MTPKKYTNVIPMKLYQHKTREFYDLELELRIYVQTLLKNEKGVKYLNLPAAEPKRDLVNAMSVQTSRQKPSLHGAKQASVGQIRGFGRVFGRRVWLL